MNRLTPFLAALGICLLLVTMSTQAATQRLTYLPTILTDRANTPTPTLNQYKQQVIDAVNAERQKAGCLRMVALQADLDAGAQAWAEDMRVNGLRHSFWYDGAWYLKHGYTRTTWISENAASGTDTGAETVVLWMDDEGHRNVVLQSCDVDAVFDAGVGYAGKFWVLAIGELHD